jgi:hypothetical protein
MTTIKTLEGFAMKKHTIPGHRNQGMKEVSAHSTTV